ncbi:MAG: AsmA family protein [Hyphomicrobium sp.]|nr:AsmA family protein [Hyphomicrobium sp.]
MNNLLVYIGGFLIVVLAALFGLPYVIDWNGFRGVFEEEASRMLGREVRVQGNVSLRLLPSPYVHAEKLRIGGAIGEETGRPLFRADGFTMWLSVPPLLKGIVEARDAQIVKPVLELAIDAQGRSTLASLKVAPGRFSFVPQDITFRSVAITDGSLGLSGPNGVELARIDGINGEVSADTAEGPFRYRGTALWHGEKREVRFNTAPRDPNGDLRFKTNITVPATTNSYTLEGTARDLADAVTIEGNLAARISTAGFAVSPVAEAGAQSTQPIVTPAKPSAFFDVTAKVASEAGRVKLDDIAISLEQGGGLPQLISGRSSITWTDQMKVDLELSSKWLDLDQLTASESAASGAIPLELAHTLFDRLVDQLPASAGTDIAIAVDQVSLGKQSVSGLELKASRNGGPLELKDVRASLPGGTNLALDGVLDGAQGARSFTGTMALSGQSLTRFATWGFGDNPFSRSRSDGPFAIAGNLKLDDKAIELTDASAEVSGTPVIGEVRLGLTEPRRLAVALEGEKIDLEDLWPGNPGLRGLRRLLTGDGNAAERDAEAKSGDGLFGSDVSFDIKAGQLIDGERKLENVHLDVSLQKGALTVPKLRFVSKGGLAVDLEGAAADVPDKTSGSLRGVIEAPSAEAMATLSDLVDLPPDIDAKLNRWSGLTPWRVATTFSFGERKEAAVDVTLDGTLRGGRVVAEARIDAARGEWRTAPADITAQIETPDVYGFLDQVSGTKSKTGDARPGKVFVKAAGTAADGLVAVAELSAETVELEFNGRVRVPDTGLTTAKGDIRVAAQDFGRVLMLAGLSIGPGAGSLPVSGTIAAAHDGAKLTLASPALKIGDAAVSGVLTYAAAADADAPATVEADLSADKASLPGLLTALSAAPPKAEAPIELPAAPARRRRGESDAPVVATIPAKIWPEAAFDFGPLDDVTGTLKAGVRSLSLEPGLAMKDARFDVVFKPGKLNVERLEGAMLGGKAVAAFTLEKLPAGATIAGRLGISISSKGSAESGADDAIDGDVASLDVNFDGRALSPAAMIASMTGKGTLQLGDVTLSGVAPRAVTEVADQALQAKGVMTGEPLQNAVRSALKATQLKLGKVTVPVNVADGLLKLDRVQVDTAEGRATFDTVLDLQTFVLDSVWKIEGKGRTRAEPSVAGAATAGKSATASAPAPVPVSRTLLPPVAVVYTGRLADLGTLAPTVQTEALERELTVRRMERDVDELERLRRLDEERARKERERQQAAEAERQRRQRELEQKLLPGTSAQPPQSAAQPVPVPVDGAAAIDPKAAAAAEATPAAEPPPEAKPRVQVQPQPKKKPANSWQPFQISPYQ